MSGAQSLCYTDPCWQKGSVPSSIKLKMFPTMISNQPITWKQLNAFGLVDIEKTSSKLSIRTEKKEDLRDSECGMVVSLVI